MMIPPKLQTTNRDCMTAESEIPTPWWPVYQQCLLNGLSNQVLSTCQLLSTDYRPVALHCCRQLFAVSSNSCSNGAGLLHAAWGRPWISTSCLCPPKESLPDTVWHKDVALEESKFLPTGHLPGFQWCLLQWGRRQTSNSPSILRASIQLLVNLSHFPRTAISHVWGPARKQIAFGRSHKALFSPSRELSKCGEGGAFSAVKAWDVFRMLEQFKKDFVFKLGMCEALDGDQGLWQVWRNGFKGA